MQPSSDASTLVRAADAGDLPAILRLYRQLHADDPPLAPELVAARFAEIDAGAGLHLLVLERDGLVLATTYLNVVVNLTRAAAPYAVIENVVVDESVRGTGVGRHLMAATLRVAWEAGCYKAMLMTGSSTPATHAYYRACGFRDDVKTAYLARP